MKLFSEKIEWEKYGQIIEVRSELRWMRSHAMIPTPEKLGDGLFKVYFSGRNDQNQSHIGWAIIDLNEPYRVLEYCSEPVLEPGELGCFDDNGVTPSCVLNHKDEKLLYYIGWNPGSTVRMHLFGGLAISKDEGKTFKRWSRAPIIERCNVDPYLNTAPWVVYENKEWKMYYVSGVGWRHKDLPRYNIKLARSKDGKNWKRDGHVCIDFQNESENALARPYVILDHGIWKMWFAHKGKTYRLGYAESEDGIHWARNDEFAGISVSDSGWDAEMVEYAAVVEYQGCKFMFYNGNDYGRHGFGMAIQK